MQHCMRARSLGNVCAPTVHLLLTRVESCNSLQKCRSLPSSTPARGLWALLDNTEGPLLKAGSRCGETAGKGLL